MAKTTYRQEELERQLSESRREFWAADATINNLELKIEEMVAQLANKENECAALAAENAVLKESEREFDKMCAEEFGPDWVSEFTETPATDSFLAEVRAQGVEMLLDVYRSRWISPHVEDADRFAAQLRKGGNQ